MSFGLETQDLLDQIANRDEVIARQAAEIILLKQSIDTLSRRIFGKSSEKLDPAQLELLLGGDLAKKAPAALPANLGPATEITTHAKRQKKTRAPRIPEHLPIVRETLRSSRKFCSIPRNFAASVKKSVSSLVSNPLNFTGFNSCVGNLF